MRDFLLLLVGFLSGAAAAKLALVMRNRRRHESKNEATTHSPSRERARLRAIVAENGRVLAHDLKKPLTLLEMGLRLLGADPSPAGVEKAVSLMKSNIGAAAANALALLEKLVRLGDESGPREDRIAARELVPEAGRIDGTLICDREALGKALTAIRDWAGSPTARAEAGSLVLFWSVLPAEGESAFEPRLRGKSVDLSQAEKTLIEHGGVLQFEGTGLELRLPLG